MEKWQKRLLSERDSLKAKFEKLVIFNRSKRFEALVKGRDLLLRQESAMCEYLNILDRRIEIWEVE